VPGFYLAIYQQGEIGVLEAFDTWLHPEVTYAQFRDTVLARNLDLSILSNREAWYTTYNGNRVQFVIWTHDERDDTVNGGKVLRIIYGGRDPTDGLGDAGNVTDKFLNGTILSSPAEAVVEIRNPFLNTTIRLDLSDKWNPKRTSETGEVETKEQEMWVDFQHQGNQEGNFYRPFKTLDGAVAAVAEGGVIKVVPGTFKGGVRIEKRVKLLAPVGGVRIGGS
jgi:hypothetical protein